MDPQLQYPTHLNSIFSTQYINLCLKIYTLCVQNSIKFRSTNEKSDLIKLKKKTNYVSEN